MVMVKLAAATALCALGFAALAEGFRLSLSLGGAQDSKILGPAVKPSLLDLEVVLIATPDTPALLKAVASIPYNTTILGLYDPLKTDREDPSQVKLAYAQEHVRQQTDDNKILMFVDAHDTLFQGGSPVACPSKASIIHRYKQTQADILISAQTICVDGGRCTAADRAQFKLNAGGVMAPVWALRAVLEQQLPQDWFRRPSADDGAFGGFQGFWNGLHARQQEAQARQSQAPVIKLDTQDHVFSSLAGRLQQVSQVYSVGLPGNHTLWMQEGAVQSRLACVLLSSNTVRAVYDGFKSYFVYAGSTKLHSTVQ